MTDYRRKLDKLLADYRFARKTAAGEAAFLAESEQKLAASLEAQKLLQEAAAAVQESAHKQIASVVTRCLKAVFGEDAYEFVIRFERKRGKTEARLLFTRDGVDIDPVSASGGGVVDVAAFALRVAALVLARPRRRRLMCLDEPFKFVSKDYRPAVRALMETLARELDMQFVVVTHDDALQFGSVVEL